MKFPREQQAALLATDPNLVSDPTRRAWVISAQKNIADAREMNEEVCEFFAGSGIRDFQELPFVEMDYRSALPILEKWMERIDNVDVVSSIANLVIRYVNVVGEAENKRLIESLARTFVRISSLVRHPGLQAQIVANVIRAFAQQLVPSQAEILESLCQKVSDDNALRIYLVEGLAKFKDTRAKSYLARLLEDDEWWVVDVAIDCCRRLNASEFIPQLQRISERAVDPKLRAKAAKCVVAISKRKSARR